VINIDASRLRRFVNRLEQPKFVNAVICAEEAGALSRFSTSFPINALASDRSSFRTSSSVIPQFFTRYPTCLSVTFVVVLITISQRVYIDETGKIPCPKGQGRFPLWMHLSDGEHSGYTINERT
jgi:hypothetical protein